MAAPTKETRLHVTALAYLKRSTPCGSIRIQKHRHTCTARFNATAQAAASYQPEHSKLIRSDEAWRNVTACASQQSIRPATTAIAVCLFGKLARFDDTRGARSTNLWLTQTVVLASLQERIFAANRNSHFDLFVHSWQVEMAPFIERTFRPLLSEYGLRSDGRSGMFLSIERALELQRKAEEARGAPYDWVLITRPDVVWMRDFQIEHLNSDLFYVANW